MTEASLKHTDAAAVYPPSDDFAAQANASAELYDDAAKDRLAFWALPGSLAS